MDQLYDAARLAREEEGLPAYDSHTFNCTTSSKSHFCEGEVANSNANSAKRSLGKRSSWLRSLLNRDREDYYLLALVIVLVGVMAAFAWCVVKLPDPTSPPERGSEENPLFVQLITRTAAEAPSATAAVVDSTKRYLTLEGILINDRYA
ncbi:unnamed protein product [Sympodiomycopsis kandeliae]